MGKYLDDGVAPGPSIQIQIFFARCGTEIGTGCSAIVPAATVAQGGDMISYGFSPEWARGYADFELV